MVYFCVVKGLEEPTKLVVLLQGEQSLLSLAISFFFFFFASYQEVFSCSLVSINAACIL